MPEPLDTDCSTIDTSFPLLKTDQVMEFRITEADVKDNEANTLMFKAATCAVGKSEKDEILNPGTNVFGTLNLVATGGQTQANINRSVGEFVQGVLPGQATSPAWLKKNAKALQGKTFRAIVGIQPERTDEKTGKTYRRSNSFKKFLKPGQQS